MDRKSREKTKQEPLGAPSEHELEIARLATFETLAIEIDKLVENIKGAGRKVSPLVRKKAGILGKATSVLFTRVQYPNGMPLEVAKRPAARADCDPDLLDLWRETAKALGRIAASSSEGTRIDDDVIEQLVHNAGELRRAVGRGDDARSQEATLPPTESIKEDYVAKACGLLVAHPDWTVAQIAEAVPVARQTLYSPRFRRFREARDALKESGREKYRRDSVRDRRRNGATMHRRDVDD